MNLSNLAVVANYDTRDSNFYPTSGRYVDLQVARDDDSWGSDFNYNRLTASYNQYFSLDGNNVIALRAYGSEVSGDAPFLFLPKLKMRGFASGRYQDNAVLSGHAEWRHKFHPRWGFLGSL